MTIVERPNKEALSRAIDIFLDEMRSMLTKQLRNVPGISVEEAIVQALPPDKALNFKRNRPQSSDLESALEASFFSHIVSHYWKDTFAKCFCKGERVSQDMTRITDARNSVSHPPHRNDVDRNYTLDSLRHIEQVLEKAMKKEAQQAVSNIRAVLENPAVAVDENILQREELQEQNQRSFDQLQDAKRRISKLETDLKAEGERTKKHSSARLQAEKVAQAAQTSHFLTTRKLQGEIAAREEAEKRARKETNAHKHADRAVQAMETDLKTVEDRYNSAKNALKEALDRVKDLEASQQENHASAQQVLSDKPLDRRTPAYELWLIDEILSGRTSRSALRQFSGHDRLAGRLIYFVEAAASEMTSAAWQGYVANRQRALLRGGKFSSFH